MSVMNVNSRKIVQPGTHASLVLRNGQIVQGEITKIHPNNKAEIQIGANRLVAEINTSLMVGKKYFFQVNGTGNQVIQLKVLGDSVEQNMQQNLTQLLDRLGLKVNRQNVQLVHALLADKIPFNQQQLSQAATLLEKMPARTETFSLIKEMFVQRLPITENVLQALHAVQNNNVSTSIHQLLTHISKEPLNNNVKQQLQVLLEQLLTRQGTREMTFQDRIGHEIQRNEWKAMLHHQASQLLSKQSAPLSREQIVTQITQLLFTEGNQHSLPTERLVDLTAQLMQNSEKLQINAKEILQRFQAALSTSTLTNQQFTALKQMVQTNIMPLLPDTIQQSFQQALNQHTQMNQVNIYQALQLLASNTTYQLLEASTQALKQEQGHFHIAAKTSLLAHIQQFTQSMGMRDEQQIRLNIEQFIQNQTEQPTKQQTIKSLLLQMMESNSQLNNKLLPFIHLINGLQLQSVHETQNMMQATLQLPGEKFSLPKDLYFQFEGKKTEEGKLDPDYCRILCFLQLQHLDETIIDMFIQKRIVSLTIYNDQKNVAQQQENSLVNMLTDHLEALDFQLSTIKWKSISEQEQQPTSNKAQAPEHYTKERFDFRI